MRKLSCFTALTFVSATLMLGSACLLPGESDANDDGPGGGQASGGDGQGGDASGGDAQGGDAQGGDGQGGDAQGGGPGLPGGWTTSSHPCVGNRTDTLLYEADDTVWVGCGSTTSGTGLYMSADGGMTWAAPDTSPSNFLSSFRVVDVSRGGDGLLYIAGIGSNGARVVSLDTSASPMALAQVLNSGPTVDENFTVGTFRLADDGSAIAESMNGHGMLYRADDTVGPDAFQDGWENARNWANGGTQSFQLLDMEEHDGAFYGCGSTIADTPKLYLPNPNAARPYHLDVIELTSGLGAYSGEMWGLDVAPDGSVVVGGVNQDANVGMVYASVGDPRDGNFHVFDVSTLVNGGPTWIRGVCTNGQRLVAVGELSQSSAPLVFTSADSGETWEELTSPAPGPVHECSVFDDGSFTVAGADGFFGIYVP